MRSKPIRNGLRGIFLYVDNLKNTGTVCFRCLGSYVWNGAFISDNYPI